ncbi:MAG: PTS transporter subunit EIIC [Bacillota bacterium]|nr:PTS transporter subunit EIIC [Bacillota bacterium]
MEKFQAILMKYLMPIANKLEQQKHIQAIKDGIVASVPVIIVGSFCTIFLGISNLIGSGPIFDFLSKYMGVLTYASAFTTDLLAVYATYFIAKALSERYALKGSQPAITSLIAFFIISAVIQDGQMSTAYLGSTGLFTGILVALVSVEIYRICIEKKLYIKMPESVPPMVAESFGALVPLVVSTFLAVAVANISMAIGGVPFPQMIMNILAPAVSSMDTLPALLIVIFLTQLLWFFGLHGPSITSSVWATFAIAYGAENIAAYAAGEPVSHIFTFGMFYAVLQATGSGLTLGLNILMMRSKAKSLSSVGKVAIVPSIFGINEPLIFGMPMIMNPIMFIPFVFGPLVCTTVAYLSMTLGIVGKPIVNPPGFLPPGVGAFLMTLDWKAVVLVFVLLALMTLMYYPFFKMLEKKEMEKENVLENK